MKLVTCNRCQSQFDVGTMSAGSSFVCGKCRNVLQVPADPPVMAPIQTVQPTRPAGNSPPPTVALSPDEMRRALQSVKSGTPPAASPASAAQPKSGPKLPAAMEARRQTQTQSRAGGSPPPTVALSPEQMKKALAEAGVGQPAAKPAPAAPAPRSPASPPPTVALSPDEMKRALAAAKGGTPPAASPSPAPAPKPAAAAPAPVAAKPAAAAPKAAPVAAAAPAAPRAAAKSAPVPVAAPLEDEPEEPAERPSRTARGARDSGGVAEKKKPPVAIIAVGAVVVVGGIAAAMMSGKGDEKSDKPVAPVVELDEYQKFAALSAGDADMAIAGKIRDANKDVAKLLAVYTWFKDPKLANSSKAKSGASQAADEAILADPSTAWAREAKGQRNALEFLKKCRDECPKAFACGDETAVAIGGEITKLESDPWVEAKRYAELEKMVAAVQAREHALANDPRAAIVEKKKNFTRQNPLFSDKSWKYVELSPFLIAQQYEKIPEGEGKKKAEDREKKALWMAQTDAHMFKHTYERWLELFGERYKFPRLETTNRVLHGIITWDRKNFEDIYRKNNPGSEIAGLIRAFYAPGEQRIFHYIGDESLTSQDEIPCDKENVQKLAFQVAAHEETHQLQHEYTAIYSGKALVDDEIDASVMRGRKLMWFEEGLAEFMGAMETSKADVQNIANAKILHNRILLERVQMIRGSGRKEDGNLREEAKKWTIEQLLKPNSNPDLQRMGNEMLPGQGGLMTNIFYARAWGLVHFLYYYDNGKYRENMLQYLETVLKGQQSANGFAKIMGRPDASSWGDIAEEFEWYWDKLHARGVGYKNVSRTTWYDMPTTPPEGKWSKDDEDEEDDGK